MMKALAAVVLALLLTAGLQTAGLADKRGLVHDEAIALLAATCHQGEFQRAIARKQPPFGTWVPAARWQRFVEVEKRGCLGRIAGDLAREDIHPPLFFWMLHGWLLLVGTSATAAPALNILLGAVTGLAVFGLARRVFADPRPAALVAAVWALSPAALLVYADGRQYALLALLAVLLTWQALRFADPDRDRPWRDGALLAVVTAAGLLTQFQFGLIAAAGGLLLAVRLRRRPRRLVGAFGALAAGGIGFVALHPRFAGSLVRAGAQSPPFDPAWVDHRVERAVAALGGFLGPPRLLADPVSVAACGALVLATGWVLLRRRRADEPADGVAMVALFAGLAVAAVGLYLAFLTPLPAVDAKHVSFLWPFAAFVPVVLLRGRRAAVPVAAALLVGLTVLSVTAVLGLYRDRPADPAVAGAPRTVIDNVARGVLLPAVWPLRQDARVFAADQGFLLARPDRWTAALRPGDVVLSDLPVGDPRTGNDPRSGARVVALVRRRFRLSEAPAPPLVFGVPRRLVAANGGCRGGSGRYRTSKRPCSSTVRSAAGATSRRASGMGSPLSTDSP